MSSGPAAGSSRTEPVATIDADVEHLQRARGERLARRAQRVPIQPPERRQAERAVEEGPRQRQPDPVVERRE